VCYKVLESKVFIKDRSGQNSASRQAAIEAKKAGTPKKGDTPVKSDIVPKPKESRSMSKEVFPEQQNIEPVVVLRKQPRILDADEIKARQTTDLQKGTLPTPGIEASMPQTGVISDCRSTMNNVSSVQEAKETGEATQHITQVMTSSQMEISSNGLKVPKNLNENEVISQIKAQPKVSPQEGNLTQNRAPSSKDKEELAVKALEKINAAQQILKQQKADQKSAPAKKNLEGLVHVKPKPPDNQQKADTAKEAAKSTLKPNESLSMTSADKLMSPQITKKSSISNDEPPGKVATVKKAAEKFEMSREREMNSKHVSESSLPFNSNLRTRSKSIADQLREQFVEDQDSKNVLKTALPWSGKSPSVIRKREDHGTKGYALQMSKSCDSITAAKLLAKARAESSQNTGGLRINKNFSKSIEQQIDVYSKTKDEIRKILQLAKVGSVTDRVALFTNMKHKDLPQVNPEEKAEAIRKEIEDARAKAQETVSDTEIEFQAPIESKVKPLKIPMKPKILNSPEKTKTSSPGTGLRINQSKIQESPKKERRLSIEDLPSVKSKIQDYISVAEETNKEDDSKDMTSRKPSILKNSQESPQTPKTIRKEKERSRSPKKKTPKLISDHYLAPNQNLQIFAQSATDVSATEDESEHSKNNRPVRKNASIIVPTEAPGPTFLQVPPKSTTESRPGVMKSKSFASPGQFECSIDESSGKKKQMMAFFGHGKISEGSKKSVKIHDKPNRSSSITSITDDIVADDDLVDIDAEFESLLNSTFEKESRKLMTSDTQNTNAQHRQFEKANVGAAASQRGKRSSGGLGGRGVSLDMSSDTRHASVNPGKNSRLQKSQSFGFNSSSSVTSAIIQRSVNKDHQDSRSSSGERVTPTDTMYQNSPVLRQKNFDPIAALPTSHTKQYHKNYSGTPPPHSPSPTQSEYDTCDPWDDY